MKKSFPNVPEGTLDYLPVVMVMQQYYLGHLL